MVLELTYGLLGYIHQRFGKRNIVEKFSRYIKQRTRRFYNNIDCCNVKPIEDYSSTITMTRNLDITAKL